MRGSAGTAPADGGGEGEIGDQDFAGGNGPRGRLGAVAGLGRFADLAGCSGERASLASYGWFFGTDQVDSVPVWAKSVYLEMKSKI